MSMLENDWVEAVGEEFKKPYYAKLYKFVKEEYDTRVVYPPADDIFNALHLTPLSEVKVLILGQYLTHTITKGRRMVCVFLLSLGCRHPLLWKIFIKSCTMIWGVKYQITAIWSNGPSRACLC